MVLWAQTSIQHLCGSGARVFKRKEGATADGDLAAVGLTDLIPGRPLAPVAVLSQFMGSDLGDTRQ